MYIDAERPYRDLLLLRKLKIPVIMKATTDLTFLILSNYLFKVYFKSSGWRKVITFDIENQYNFPDSIRCTFVSW